MRAKTLVLLGVLSGAAAAQPFGAGFKVGLPLNDAFDIVSSSNVAAELQNKNYIWGPQFELRLPAGFSIELDALYTSFEVRSIGSIAGSIVGASFDADSWEFPLMLKKKFGGADAVAVAARPFVTVGASFRRLSDVGGIRSFITESTPSGEVDKTARGFVIGGGVEIRALFIRFSPEFRFTHWGTENIREGFSNILKTNRNQGQFLVGIHF